MNGEPNEREQRFIEEAKIGYLAMGLFGGLVSLTIGTLLSFALAGIFSLATAFITLEEFDRYVPGYLALFFTISVTVVYRRVWMKHFEVVATMGKDGTVIIPELGQIRGIFMILVPFLGIKRAEKIALQLRNERALGLLFLITAVTAHLYARLMQIGLGGNIGYQIILIAISGSGSIYLFIFIIARWFVQKAIALDGILGLLVLGYVLWYTVLNYQ